MCYNDDSQSGKTVLPQINDRKGIITMAEIHSKIINCTSCGKYYDVAKQNKCPYCGAAAPASNFSETIDVDAPGAGGSINRTVDLDTVNNNAISGNFIKTLPPEDIENKNDTLSGKFPKTEDVSLWDKDENDSARPSADKQIAPVVGWIVALTGPYKGTDYKVHAGYNDIGRETGDIVISGDNTISREKDANVTYVPQTNKYYIAHVQGKSVLTVNDAPVVGGTIELKAYDVITIGNTRLLFIPLCGSRFNWKDGVSDG